MISRCSERNAIENGSERGPDDMLTKPSEMPGNRISNASAVMPPIDGPTVATSRLTPRCLMTSKPPRATSSSDSTGNLSR